MGVTLSGAVDPLNPGDRYSVREIANDLMACFENISSDTSEGHGEVATRATPKTTIKVGAPNECGSGLERLGEWARGTSMSSPGVEYRFAIVR
jgi:hypothetical protein